MFSYSLINNIQVEAIYTKIQTQGHGRSQDFGSGGIPLGVGLVGGQGGGAPRTQGNFRKFSKNFLRKLLKMNYFRIFSKNLTNHTLIFREFGRKTHFLEKFEKNLKVFDDNSIGNIAFLIIC